MKEVADGIELACSDLSDVTSNTNTDIKTKSLHLPYRDNSTGEYKCGENDLIYVKFRSKFCRKTCFHNMKRKCLIFLYCLYTFITYLSTVMLRKKMSAPVFIHNVCLCVCVSPACDSCVEIDTPSLISMVVGNVVATIVVGVGVYLIASQTSQTRTGPVVSNKKSKSKDYLSI